MQSLSNLVITSGTLEQALCNVPHDERTYLALEVADEARKRRLVTRPVPWVGRPIPSVGESIYVDGLGNGVKVVRIAHGYPGRMRISGQ